MDTRGAHTALTCDDVLWRTNVDGSEGSSKLAMPVRPGHPLQTPDLRKRRKATPSAQIRDITSRIRRSGRGIRAGTQRLTAVTAGHITRPIRRYQRRSGGHAEDQPRPGSRGQSVRLDRWPRATAVAATKLFVPTLRHVHWAPLLANVDLPLSCGSGSRVRSGGAGLVVPGPVSPSNAGGSSPGGAAEEGACDPAHPECPVGVGGDGDVAGPAQPAAL